MDTELQDFADRAVSYAEKSGVEYCDARAEQQERKSVLLENNEIEYVRTNDDRGIGIRLIKNNVWSFCSITNPKSYEQIKDAIDNSIKSTINNKKNKIDMYPNNLKKTKIDYKVVKKPELEEIIKIGFECSKIILETPKIKKIHCQSMVYIKFKIFCKF